MSGHIEPAILLRTKFSLSRKHFSFFLEWGQRLYDYIFLDLLTVIKNINRMSKLLYPT